ncbi:MerR family transcriptional regulator [Paraferrimonas sedimenticola]|uniref:Methyltransferase n=1 Tax=Paraferrimonas sedimenticola TaxID=375674 RepID=A0AA37S081_9GAMM|nr:MerR family transcriptional regulator [Paraferrimonas sedimenticola]GLP97937.1 methyltransferase [Paraferrimonas sedimenticola]
MYRISELANAVGLSRSTLLYYEKQNIICGKRQANGYRVYDERDLQNLRFIQLLQAGGLTLKECKACMDAKLDTELLQNRLQELEREIAQKLDSKLLLEGLLGGVAQKDWHLHLQSAAPDVHLDWLRKQGFDEKQALRLKWLSKDMNEHDTYMADFMKVYETLERWGPGSESETLKAFKLVGNQPKTVLEIGCGKGLATRVLAEQTGALITAVDNEQSALDALDTAMTKLGYGKQVSTVCSSMTELPFEPNSFDLIWAEGSAYIMGVEKALKAWKPLLSDDGVMMISDLVWLTDDRTPEVEAFWLKDYPDIQTVDTRLAQIEAAGYQVKTHFTLSQQAWENYFVPLDARIQELASNMGESQALKDIATEIGIYRNYLGQFGYQMFILAPN